LGESTLLSRELETAARHRHGAVSVKKGGGFLGGFDKKGVGTGLLRTPGKVYFKREGQEEGIKILLRDSGKRGKEGKQGGERLLTRSRIVLVREMQTVRESWN